MSRRYEAMGADALLIIAPYYNKANAEGMYRHFADTADAVSVPCILYNVPGRTGCSIPVSVVERLAKHPNICGIKEASGNMSYAMEVARFLGPDFQMWSGNDDITVPIMSVGGCGRHQRLRQHRPRLLCEDVHRLVRGPHRRSGHRAGPPPRPHERALL